ncbi:MAG TPA: carboxypeptidase regulatory-like domain-containing protein [Pyrinomonadaceae bacterium]|jgi:outer membrane receptor protein involved in Fe transport
MKIRVLMLALALFVPFVNVAAQTSRGTVSGVVTDPAGAVIRGASVTLTNTQTNVSRQTTANDEGFYRFDAVELGTYTVVIGSPGFGELTKANVVVNANQNSQIDAQLAPGGQQVTVDVVAEAGAALQTEAPARGGNISARQVTELPIASRNPALLALTLPGVSSNRFGFGIGTFSVNGARGRSNNFLLDGIENNDTSVAGQGYQVTNPDAVAEVSVQTSNFDAEFGRAGGAVINTITKSGTNEFHGTLSAFLDSTRDDAITSSLSRDPRIAARGRLDPGTQQVYAGTIGGPVYLPRFGEGGPGYWSGKNRTFFFASYQEERQLSTGNTSLTTPTAAGRERLRQIFAPGASSNLDTYLGVTQNSVATSGFQNIAIGARPGCDAPCNIQFGTFVGTYANVFKDRQAIGRIDHTIDENDQFSARYVYGNRVQPTGALANFVVGFEVGNINATQNLLLQEIHTFSPSLTNDLRVGYGRIAFDFPISGANPLATSLGTININQLTPAPAIGVPSNFPQGRISNNYILQDTMTHVRGDHTFRFGLEVLNQRSRQQVPFRARPDLTYQASTGFTGFANFIDDFGGSGGAAQRDFGVDVFYPRRVRQSYFFQDRWRASDELTLTLGLRYEDFGRPVTSLATQTFTGLFNLDPVTRTGPYSEPNEAPKDLNNFAPTVGVAYAPAFREGLLGTLFSERRTVIRAGYQVTYDSFFDNIASNAAASSPNIVATAVNSVVSAANPRGLPNLAASLPTAPRPLSPLDGQTLVARDLVNPYYQRWSLGLQRELPSNFIVDVSYVGSKGTKLYLNEDLNPVLPESMRSAPPAGYPSACTPGTNLTAAQAAGTNFAAGTPCPLSNRLDILQGARLTRTNGGSSSYHAGQLEVRRRFADNLALTASYTWSKLIDNGSEVFAVANINLPQQAARPPILGFSNRLERSVSLFDRTHRAVFTYVYQLPWMSEQRGFLGRVLGGWEWSGVTTFETGVPVTVANGADADGIGGNFDRPDVNPAGVPGTRAIPSLTVASASNPAVAATNVCGVTTVGTLFYTDAPSGAGACIGLTPGNAYYIGLLANSGRTGNLGRNTLRTPGTNLFDMNFTKRTRISENVRLEFRTEVFNIFNHPNYLQGSVSPFTPAAGNLPVTVLTSVAGRFLQPNTVGTDGGGRTIRYQLKLVF